MKNIVTSTQRREIRKLIREEFVRKQIINEHVDVVCRKMVIYENKSLRKGLDQESINEGLVLIINEGFGDVGFDMIKRYLGGKLLNFLGINQSEDPILFTFFQNILEAIEYTEITKYFGSGACEPLMDMLTEAIVETVTEMGGEKVISYLAVKFLPNGISNTVQDALDSSLANVSQEAINEVVVGLVKGYLQEPLRVYVCEGKLMDAVSGMFGGGGSDTESGDSGFDLGGLGQTALSALGGPAASSLMKSFMSK
jgi:hypothetical protein